MIPILTSTWPLANCSQIYGVKDFDAWMLSCRFKWNETSKETRITTDPQLSANNRECRSVSQNHDSSSNSSSAKIIQADTYLLPVSYSGVFPQSSPSVSTPSSSPASSFSFSQSITSPPSSSSSSPLWSSSPTTKPPFKTEYFEVRDTKKKGFAAFAICDIEAGTVIMKERPLVKATAVTLFQDLETLSLTQRAEYFTLHGWTGPQVYCDVNRSMAIFMTNRFEITNAVGGIFLKCSRFNHACNEFRNCTYRYNSIEDCLVIKSLRAIRKGEEITISYSPTPSTLYENYGFYCDCPACPRPEVARAIAERSRQSR